MPRNPDKRIETAYALYKGGSRLVDIANQIGVAEGTVRSWKNRYKWEKENECNVAKEKRNVAKKKKAIAEDVSDVIENEALTDKQRLFCLIYVRCFNATKAYQKAYGVDYKTAASISYRLLENDGIREEIKRLKQNRLNMELLDVGDIVQKYMDIAFADLTDYVEFRQEDVPVMGAFGPVEVEDKVTGGKKILTKRVNVVRFKDSDIVDGTIIAEVRQGKDGASIRLSDRMKALDWLGNYFEANPADVHKREFDRRRLEIELLKLENFRRNETEEISDDNFIETLQQSAKDVWKDDNMGADRSEDWEDKKRDDAKSGGSGSQGKT